MRVAVPYQHWPSPAPDCNFLGPPYPQGERSQTVWPQMETWYTSSMLIARHPTSAVSGSAPEALQQFPIPLLHCRTSPHPAQMWGPTVPMTFDSAPMARD